MYQSLETRWFYRGELPQPVRESFMDGAGDPRFVERIDAYLLMPEVDTVGVKIREGRFEIKARVGPEEDAELLGIASLLDRWVKWSHHAGKGKLLDKLITNPAFGESPERWMLVRKRRLMRKLALDSSADARPDQVVELSPGQRAESGCGLELTELAVLEVEPMGVHHQLDQPWADAEPWWTVGFEAFGSERDRAFEASLDALGHLVPTQPPLAPTQAGSYPAWLCVQFPRDGSPDASDSSV